MVSNHSISPPAPAPLHLCISGGGTGKAFDWTLVDQLRGVPVILAGGLGPHNVADAVNSASAQRILGVDVSSGVEMGVGLKDAAKVEAFVANARNARK